MSTLDRGRFDPVSLDARNPLRLVGAVASAAALAVVGGPGGAVAGVAVALAALALAGPYWIAAAHVALIAVTDAPTAPQLAVVEAAFLTVLVGEARTGPNPTRVAAGTVVAAVALAAVTAAALDHFGDLRAAAAVLAGTVAAALYALHRYERVALRLASGLDDRPAESGSEADRERGPGREDEAG